MYSFDPTTRPQCGTYAGRMQHQYWAERCCDACAAAHRAYQAAYRRRGRCAPGLGWPLGPNDPAPRTRGKRVPKWVLRGAAPGRNRPQQVDGEAREPRGNQPDHGHAGQRAERDQGGDGEQYDRSDTEHERSATPEGGGQP